ncbi:MAG: HD domain-containing protein [Bacteroidota bacterium]
MNREEESWIAQTVAHVKSEQLGEGSGHDWWHTYRVWKNARQIAQSEIEADLVIVELAALLHDIADHKFHGGDLEIGPKEARMWLERIQVPQNYIQKIVEIIANLSFKGAKVPETMKSIEGKIVQDADRLDAIGAIGIGRTFAYGGYAGQEMYDPSLSPTLHTSFESYSHNKSTTVNHFYEKLLLLKDRMHTPTAKQLAKERHEFMENFLKRFFQEWEGKS